MDKMDQSLIKESPNHRLYQPLKVLIIEGNIVARKVIARTLNSEQHVVFEAKSSQEAFAHLEKDTPDLIFLATTLIKEDGYSILNEIRNASKFQNTPIIMLSSDSRSEIKNHTTLANEYLIKPFKPVALLKIINKYSRLKRLSSTHENEVIADTKKQLRILVIEDSLVVRKVIVRTLTTTNHKVFEAKDGQEALEKLIITAPDLILLDIILPDKDGYQVLNEIRKISRFKHTPVIFLSAKDSLLDKIKGKISEANEYLTKPFRPEELIHIVSKYLD